MKKKTKKFVIVQYCSIYRNDIGIFVGYDSLRAYEYAKKHKWRKYAVDLMSEHHEWIDATLETGTPQLRKNGSCIIFFKSWDGSMDNYDTLYHELYHSVRHISDALNMGGEEEACAYLIEYLHREIRRKLNKKAGIR